jgi:hypothetical protein
MPVISVDTKKKELVGNFKNGGREWQPEGEPELVDVHEQRYPKARELFITADNGTRSNTGFSRSFRATGEADRSARTRRSST